MSPGGATKNTPQTTSRREERSYVGGYELYRTFGSNALIRETFHVMDDQQRIAIVETRTTPTLEAPLIRYQLDNLCVPRTVSEKQVPGS